MGLIAELKRRNVLRMAALYIAAAWLVIEVAGALIDLSVLPERAGFWVFVTLAIGFPIALFISWFFELTPEGVALDKDVQATGSVTSFGGRRMDFVIIAILSAGLILFAYDKWWGAGPDDLSIAVLPFDNVSSDPEQEYFSDGISDEIINLLAQIRLLKVTARHSSFWFKGKDADIATIAEKLNVRHILEGSVRRDGNRVRITAQLIDAEDSTNLWSQVYDRDLSAASLFHVQSEVARAISGRLKVKLTEPEKDRLAKVRTENTEAYEAYLIGRDRLKDTKVAGLEDAVEQFTLAIELDPKFAGAYSGLADACYLYGRFSRRHSNEHCPPSAAGREQLARKALELDPESGEAWMSLGSAIRAQADGSFESMPKVRRAIAAFERGLELSSDRSEGYHWQWYATSFMFGHLYSPPTDWIKAWKSGRWESILNKGLEVDPLSIPLHYQKSRYPWVARSKEEAIQHGRRIVEIAPDSPRGYETLGKLAWDLQGRIDESIRWASKALEIDPQRSDIAQIIGRGYSALGDPDMALAYIDLAKGLVAPDNNLLQNNLVVEEAIIRLVSGDETVNIGIKLGPLLSQSMNDMSFPLGIFIDLAAGRPGVAFGRFESVATKCLGAKDIPKEYFTCPNELVRVYQELGDSTAARNLGGAIVQRTKTWSEGWPYPIWRLDYAAALALTGQTDEALDVLEDLVSSGFRGDYRFTFLRFMFCCDVTFDSIRDDQRFKAIVATIEADMAQQLENVREMERRGEVPTLEEVKALNASKQ
jgi:TolB-like protein/Flp pilus assembly protein TadD